MADFKIDEAKILQKLDLAIQGGAEILLDLSKTAVPRNWDNPPKALDFKGKFYNKPRRNVRAWNKNYYIPVVANGGKFYSWVTGNLKNSIGIEKISNGNYAVGVMQGPTEIYAWTQEFWDPSRNIPARSFLRKPLDENKIIISARISQLFSELLNNG